MIFFDRLRNRVMSIVAGHRSALPRRQRPQRRRALFRVEGLEPRVLLTGTITMPFQYGLDSYDGARDTKILSTNPTVNYSTAQLLEVDGRPDYAALLDWDISRVPSGVTVESASIRLNITNTSRDVYEIYEVRRPWVENEATWQLASAGAAWSVAGAQGAEDIGSTVLGEIISLAKGSTTYALNAAGVALVQRWVDDPASNHGLILQDYQNAANGFDFYAREAANLADRPMLTVTFRSAEGDPNNQRPAADDISTLTPEDSPVDIGLSGSDPENDPLTFVVVDGPTHGSLSGDAPRLTYTPDNNYFGIDTFSYQSHDGIGPSAIATVTITITPVNDAPVAVDESYTTQLDQSLVIDTAQGVLSNDTDEEGDPLTAVVDRTTLHGALDLGADGSFTYRPQPGFIGSDTFVYRAADGTTTSSPIEVTISVIDTSTSSTTSLSFQDGLDGYNGARDTKILSSNPASNYGSAQMLEVDGRPDYAALLAWDLRAIPSGVAVESASIQLAVANTSRDEYEIYEVKRPWIEREATWEQASAGTPWSASGAQAPGDIDSTILGQVTAPSNGVTTYPLNAAGVAVLQRWIDDPASNHGLILQDYQNAANGFDFYSREAADPNDRPMLTITFRSGATNSNNQPPTADDLATSTPEDAPIDLVLSGSDVDNDPLTFAVLDRPSHGSLAGNAPHLTYTPGDNFAGTDTFSYQSHDGIGPSPPATVTIIVTPVNDAPVALNDSHTVPTAGATLASNDVDGNGTPNTKNDDGVLVNDRDIEDDDLSAVLVSGPHHAAAFTLHADGTFTYTHDGGTETSDSFTYRADDGGATNSSSNVATVTLTIAPPNTAPRVAPATFQIQELSANGTEVGTVTATDDNAGQTLTFRIDGGNTDNAFAIDAATGTLRVNNSSALDFDVTRQFTLIVTATDDGAPPLSGSAEITINVTERTAFVPFSFRAMGDVPYTSSKAVELADEVANYQPETDEFMIHIGDIKSGSSACTESVYQNISDMLLTSTIPVFITLGDNEWNDCSNPSQARAYWDQYFTRFEENFDLSGLDVSHQSVRDENVAFVHNNVLFVGVNLVGGRLHDANEWAERISQDADWLNQMFDAFGDQVSHAVVFGHAFPNPDSGPRQAFGQALVATAQQFDKPILYIQGDSHSFRVDHPFSDAPNITRLIVGQDFPSNRVTVTGDPSQPFVIARPN